MERMLPISGRVHSGLSVLARIVRLPIVLVSLLFVTVFQTGSQDNQALIQEALSAAPPEVAKTATRLLAEDSGRVADNSVIDLLLRDLAWHTRLFLDLSLPAQNYRHGMCGTVVVLGVN